MNHEAELGFVISPAGQAGAVDVEIEADDRMLKNRILDVGQWILDKPHPQR